MRALLLVAITLAGVRTAHGEPRQLDLSPPPLAGTELAEGGGGTAAPSPAEIAARLDFLTTRLDASEFAGDLWYYGWLGVYGTGITFNATRAAVTEDADRRVASMVNIGKAVVGVTQMLLDPLPARLGADPIRAMAGGGREQQIARLRAAEALLEESAERAERKFTPWPHLSNAALNLAGGGIILAFGDWRDAALSTGLGLVVGEIRILTLPGRPADNLASYRGRYGSSPAPAGAGWSIEPRPNGAALVLRF